MARQLLTVFEKTVDSRRSLVYETTILVLGVIKRFSPKTEEILDWIWYIKFFMQPSSAKQYSSNTMWEEPEEEENTFDKRYFTVQTFSVLTKASIMIKV